MKITTVLCTVLVGAFALGACDKKDKAAQPSGETAAPASDDPLAPAPTPVEPPTEAAAPTEGAAAPSEAIAPPTPAAGPGKVEVLAEGSEPRFELRYQAPAGTKQGMEVSTDITMEMGPMGKMAMPTMIFRAKAEIASIAPDGRITNKMTFTGMEVRDTKDSMPGMADMLKGEVLDKIKGTAMTMVMEPNGRVVDVSMSSPDPMIEQMMGQTRQGFDQMVAELPQQALGKGGKWRVQQTVDQNGMKIDQTTDFEVLAITRTSAKVKGVVKMSAGKQEINQGGMAMTLEKLTGSGTLTMDIDFTKIVPKVDGKIDMKMNAGVMGQTMDINSSTTMKVRPTK
jgi:hypothetical protein